MQDLGLQASEFRQKGRGLYMSYSPNSFMGGDIGDYVGDYYRGKKRGILGV